MKSDETFAIVIPAHGRHSDIRLVLAHLDAQAGELGEAAQARVSIHLAFDNDPQGYELFTTGRPLDFLPLTCHRLPAGGPSPTRNYGAWVSGADVVAFLDSDIVPADGYLGALLQCFDSAPDAAVIRGPVVAAPARPSRWFRALVRGVFVANDGLEWFYSSANFAWRREAFLACGGFDPLIRMPSCEDLDLCWRWLIRENGKIAFCRKMSVVHPTTKMSASAALREFGRKRFDAILFARFPVRYARVYLYQWAQFGVLAFLVAALAVLAALSWPAALGLVACGLCLGFWRTTCPLEGLTFTRWERVSGVVALPLLPFAYAVNFIYGLLALVLLAPASLTGRRGRWGRGRPLTGLPRDDADRVASVRLDPQAVGSGTGTVER